MTQSMEVITRPQAQGPPTGTIAPSPALLPSPSPSLDQVREYIRASKAENTLRGYQSDWRAFCSWAEARAVRPLPTRILKPWRHSSPKGPRGLKVGSIQRRLNAIARGHKAMGLESPARTMQQSTNTHEGHSPHKGRCARTKDGGITADIRAMVDATDAGHNRHARPGTNPCSGSPERFAGRN